MNDYTISVNDNKYNFKILTQNIIELNGTNFDVELSQLSQYSYLLKVDNRVYQITSNKNSATTSMDKENCTNKEYSQNICERL